MLINKLPLLLFVNGTICTNTEESIAIRRQLRYREKKIKELQQKLEEDVKEPLSLERMLKDLIRHLPLPVVFKRKNFVRGLYLCGGVGRGKTMLMDLFYSCLPPDTGQRYHFHRFMQRVHDELTSRRGNKNPLKDIAAQFASETKVICFDEFNVSDISDAMLLGGLLEALFERNVVLVATSNQHPDQLYYDGLQRDRFLPAISCIKKNTEIIKIDSGIDYRLEFFDHAEIYHSPLDENAHAMLENDFRHLCPDKGTVGDVLEIEGREIETIRYGDGVIWFDFNAICSGPRGVADYIEIARQFQTVLISSIPIMSDNDNDMLKRFITLGDEFYDRNVKLIITAETIPSKLYKGRGLAEPFKRTKSRLEEMRTHDYLAKQHLP